MKGFGEHGVGNAPDIAEQVVIAAGAGRTDGICSVL
jgi:hypothetical protein